MSAMLPFLRACEAKAGLGISKLSSVHSLSRCCAQSTFWLQSASQSPSYQLQQLHTSAVAAFSAAAAAQQQPSGQAAAAAHDAPSSGSSVLTQSDSKQLQPVQADGLLSSLQTGLGSKQMDAQHIGLYYDFNKALIPEAFQPFHQAFYTPRPAKHQRKGGCRALQAELALTHRSSLMWRRSTQELQQALSSGAVPRMYLKGAPGSGKSIALVQMVEWARSNGWIVLYVPSATELTRGGFFYQRPGTDTYDTIISAQHILKSMGDNHATELSKLQLRLEGSKQLMQSPAAAASSGSSSSAVAPTGADADAVTDGKEGRKGQKKSPAAAGDVGGTLMQLVVAGLSTDEDGQLAVECCLALIKELAAVSKQQPVLLAVDDYNALHFITEYGKTSFREPKNGPAYSVRKPLVVEQLNLARNMRLLERGDLVSCRVVVSDSSSNRIPVDIDVPAGDAAVYHMPRFSEVETAHALFYYHECGLTGEAPSARQVSAMRALTNGSGSDLRQWCLKVTQTDMGLL